jgi:hypothetical protein
MVNPSITGTSPDCYLDVIGGPAAPWRDCLPVKQRKRGYWHHSD